MNTTPDQAIQIIINAHTEKRRNLAKAVTIYQADVDGLRKNAKRAKREEYERRLSAAKNSLEQVIEFIHTLDTFSTHLEEYAEISKQVEALCERKREIGATNLIESMLKRVMRDGNCLAM